MKIIAGIIEGLGKWLSYKTRFEGKLDTVLSQQLNQERRLLRLEIMEAMRRNDRAVVHSLYDEYKNKYNGNSYMNELYKQYTSEKPTKKRSKK